MSSPMRLVKFPNRSASAKSQLKENKNMDQEIRILPL